MKIKSLTLQNYKRFLEPKTFDFYDKESGEVNEITLLVGDNGSGKSSILQAIILLLAQESNKKHMTKLNLPGLDIAYIQTGNMPIRVEANIEVSEQELLTTVEYANRRKEAEKEDKTLIITPSPKIREITLRLNYEKYQVLSNNRGALSGYFHATKLKKLVPNYRELFLEVGTILWYDEQRTSYNMNDIGNTGGSIDKVRDILVSAFYFHTNLKTNPSFVLQPGQQDNFLAIQELYQKIFPNKKLIGAAPRRDDPSLVDFWLSDGKQTYELGGMSAGERAIFPILMDFALLNINNSIILIDEVELHLHPTLQQLFIDLLPKLGKNNQFILTTHSRSVASLFSPHQIIKMSDYV